jgi:hypothetical protein
VAQTRPRGAQFIQQAVWCSATKISTISPILAPVVIGAGFHSCGGIDDQHETRSCSPGLGADDAPLI